MSDETTSAQSVREGERIAKVMARAGLCSRRDAEAWIAAGRVAVNGRVLDSPAYNVSESDDVRIDGQRLAGRERTRLFLFHKASGLVTTARDPEGRPTIFSALPKDLPRVVAVGRLDINTEGLILLTNDGGLARVLELPATGWLRRYRVRAHGRIDQAKLDSLGGGVSLDGVDYAGIEARLDRVQGSNAWITMGLREGKNREIKKVLEHLGLAVNRLIRVSFGPFELGDLAEGEVAEVRTRVLRDQLGAKLAREAGADFEAPIVDRNATEPVAGEGARRPAPKGQPAAEYASGGRNRGGERARPMSGRSAAAPRPGPPPPSRPERRRKHVSALRAEIAAEAAGPRKRIERGATRDRNGRTVAVERLSPTGEDARRRTAGPARRTERAAGAERPRRPDAGGTKRARDGEGRERAPRAEDEARAQRRDFEPGKERGGGRDRRGAPRPPKGSADRPGGREQRRGAGYPDARLEPGSGGQRRTGDRTAEGPGAREGAKRPSAGVPGGPRGKRPPRGPGGGPHRPPRKR